MQDEASEHEIGECPIIWNSSFVSYSPCPIFPCAGKGVEACIPFLAHALELAFVFGVGLDAEGGREDELTDCGAEAGEEGVERLSLPTLASINDVIIAKQVN